MNAVIAIAEPKTLPIEVIQATPECQPRAEIVSSLVQEYAELMRQGTVFPPLKVCFDGRDYWLYDGFHRRLAGIKAGLTGLPVAITDGTRRDATLLSLGQNDDHGLRRTNADKRRAVQTLLEDPEWTQWSNREIARQCAVDRRFVDRLRDSSSGDNPQMPATPRTATRGGKTYTINTAKIGKKKADDDDIPYDLAPQTAPATQAEGENSPAFVLLKDWSSLAAADQTRYLQGIATTKGFNRQSNDSIEWAQWSWNPITGCRHDCVYCYARDIAMRFYEQKFEPAICPDRLRAPVNMRVPAEAQQDPAHRNVFTCSMADLFGRWVPGEWIDAVLQQVRENPQWNFLFLTKFPKRLTEFEFPQNAWLGATVDCQARVKATEDAFEKISGGTRWLSIEPLLQPLQFTRLNLFQWVVIGGSSRSTQTPEWIPPFDWISDIHQAARQSGCRIYHKANLGLTEVMRVKEFPWVEPAKKELPNPFKYLPGLQ